MEPAISLMPTAVEGFDDDRRGMSWGEYSLDSVFVRNEIRSVSDVIRRIDARRYVLDPDFQREFVWPEDKQSKLIESCIIRIPLPVFYLAEAKDGRIVVVDGLQRLTTFHRFVKGSFRLKGLANPDTQTEHPLEGKRFSNLPVEIQERVLDTQLITYILDAKAPERARLDIFERVNSGVPLTRQQMRNALYSGPATVWLKQAADSAIFKLATGDSLDRKAMRDREAINRFCSFHLLGWSTYKGDMETFLAHSLETMNGLNTADLSDLRSKFLESMRQNRALFGDHAFRKSISSSKPEDRRNVLNVALFDVCSVLFAKYADRLSSDQAIGARFKVAFKVLLDDDRFVKSITYSTNSTQAVTARFGMAETVLAECLS
ncbi:MULTISPECIES: DUF262 domain-containing protein [unclassified Bradyrhizobium]|uniref:DUF262 domain-containing protein n=1 Tax=unclassified Bradyrhizobium TaxID=2631580 RepID=UPI0028E3EE8A|nr:MULTISPECIES: DUF262 domain-containing protein [unclassified Bradyrhizobium]